MAYTVYTAGGPITIDADSCTASDKEYIFYKAQEEIARFPIDKVTGFVKKNYK
jgi:hypothetical protein